MASTQANMLGKKLRRLTGKAVADYAMIEDDDRIMACLSGGKDSYTLLDMLLSLQRNAPVSFDVVAVNLDQKQPNFPAHVLPDYLDTLGIEYHIVEEDTYSIVKAITPEGKTYCPVCSRLRRGVLYSFARRIGATKIALGHHADDAVETLFLNMFHGGRMKSMPPKLLSDDGDHVVIRPLYYIRERDIARWSKYREHPIIPCNLCGSQENLERPVIKRMLAEWDAIQPGRGQQHRPRHAPRGAEPPGRRRAGRFRELEANRRFDADQGRDRSACFRFRSSAPRSVGSPRPYVERNPGQGPGPALSPRSSPGGFPVPCRRGTVALGCRPGRRSG